MILWGVLTFLRITGVEGSLPRSSGEVGNVIGGLKGTLQKTNRRNLLSNPSYTGPDDPTGELEIGSHADYPWYDNRVLHPISTSNLRGLSSCTSYSSYTDYQKTTAMNMCSLYGGNCASSDNQASGSGDDSYCAQRGFAFIGISFSVLDHDGENGCPNVNYYPDNDYHDNIDQSNNYGNPNSYALNNQLPLQCLLDRTYKYISSSDIDGWLIGGGNHYEAFDGKMPYIDSSHTELLRIGSVDANQGGMSMDDIYEFFDSIWLPPIRVYPTYFKGNNDMELKVNIWETYTGGEYCVDNGQLCGCPDSEGGEGDYEWFSDCIIDKLAGESECADDDMTGPHVSAIRGVKYKSDDQKDALILSNNNLVMAWQDAYPEGVNIGTQATNIMFTDDDVSDYETEHGYGAMYFFFGRVAITKAFRPSRNLTETELAYSEFTLYNEFNSSDNYDASAIEYSGSNQEGDYDCYDYNFWDSDYWDNMSGKTLPCNCAADGEAFLGIALAKHVQLGSTSAVNGGAYENFQTTFRLSQLTANMTDYILGFDSNHATTVGLHYDAEENGFATIIEEDNAHIKLFPLGNLDPNYGGIDISDVISTVSKINFSELVIKPAFVAIEANNGDVVLYWEMECNSAIGQLFNELAALLGNPIFECDGVTDGSCGPSFSNSPQYFCAGPLMSDTCDAGCAWNATGPGSFCLQTTLMYAPIFQDDMAATYLTSANKLVDSWRFESTTLENGTISINYNSPIAATAMSSSIWAKGEKVSNSGHKPLCNGNPGCLTVFYNPMHPYASIPPCRGDGTVYYRSYYDAFGMASDNSDGDYDHQIDILTKTTDTVKVLMKGIVLITVSLIFSFSALIGYRKYSRRRKKGMSASEIFFGRASKGKRSRGGKKKKKKKKSTTERRSDKNKDRGSSPGRDKSRNRKSLDDGKKSAKKKKIKRKSVEDAQMERANKADAMVSSLLRKQQSSSASNPYNYPNLTNSLSQSSRQYEPPETYTIPNDVRGSPRGKWSSSDKNPQSRHDSYEHSTVERSSSGSVQYDTFSREISERSPPASSTSYTMPDDDDSVVDKKRLKSISSSKSTSSSAPDRREKSSRQKGRNEKKKNRLGRSRSGEEGEIAESNTFLV